MFALLPLIATERNLIATIIAFLAVPHELTPLAGVVYSLVSGSLHTERVG